MRCRNGQTDHRPQPSFALPLAMWAVVTAFTLQPVQAAADGSNTRSSVHTKYEVHLIGRYNPDGVALFVGGIYEHAYRMTAGPETPFSHLQAGLSAGISPSMAEILVLGEWMPAPFLQIRLQYDLNSYFGQHGSLLSFDSPDAYFGSDELEDREGDEESTFGQRILLRPVIRARFRRLVFRSQTDASLYYFHGEGPYYYETQHDTLLKDGDTLLTNITHFLFEKPQSDGKTSFLVGPFYEITHAVDAEITRQRVGGQLIWTASDFLSNADRTRVYAQVGVNLEDRNRKNEAFVVLACGIDL